MSTAATAYLVLAGEYEDRQVIAVLAVEAEARAFADDFNLRTRPRPHDWARAEPVGFYGPGWRPAPREVLGGEVIDVRTEPLPPELTR